MLDNLTNKLFIFLLLLFLQTALTTSGEDSRSYRPYYKSINEAELSVVELNFARAYDIYSKTFAQFDRHQRTDLYNASLCAILTGNVHQAKLWMKELITLGFTLNNFEASIFKRLPSNEWNEIKAEYNFFHNVYKTSLDTTYLATLDSMRSQEQRLVNGLQSRYDSLLYVHAKALYNLITERGIPRDAEYGGQPLPLDVMCHNFGLRNRLKYYIQSGIDTAAEPYKSMNFKAYDLETLLKDAVFRGELTPRFVAECMSHSEIDSTRQFVAFDLIVDLNTRTITQLEPNQNKLQLIDAYRMSLGLESSRDAAKKDIEIALLYNQEKFPFDEFIRRFREIGYTETALKEIRNKSMEEYHKLNETAIESIYEISKKVLKNDNIELNNDRDSKPINIESKWELLKQFRLGKAIVSKGIKNLER